ncbi:hypothetical protein TruAng_003803 [Truncatella angustata]|nr:hypothetical protein TruAng_003803 [Truncatella angustata]
MFHDGPDRHRKTAEMGDKGCGTCRVRKVLCDRTTPSCLRCSRSGRNCEGYGLRLSWPRANNRRRALIGTGPTGRARTGVLHNDGWVNASSRDIELHYSLSSRGPRLNVQRLVLHAPVAWNPSRLADNEGFLLQYFQHTASQSLATIGQDPTELGQTLLRMSLLSNTPSSSAVLHAMLAFSSVHRHGMQSQAGELKISALRALAAATKYEIGAREAIQHVATGMLLCSFEIHENTCTSGQWVCYLKGIKDIMKAASISDHPDDEDFITLLDWVHYHEVLANFSLPLWHGQDRKCDSTPRGVSKQVLHTAPVAIFALLELLSEVCQAVPIRQNIDSAEHLEDYQNYLNILEWKIASVKCTSVDNDSPASSSMAELFQLSLLVSILANVSSPYLCSAAKRGQIPKE